MAAFIQPNYPSHTQAVELSTRGGEEFDKNVSRDSSFRLGVPSGDLTTSWQFELRDFHKDIVPGTTVNRNRGLYFRFEPKHQFPYRTLHIDSVHLPIWGMMSHVVGKVEWIIEGIPDPQPTNLGFSYTPIDRVAFTGFLVGWDCDSPLDVLNKYYKLLTASIDPRIAERMITFEKSPAGAFFPVIHIPGVTMVIRRLPSNSLYSERFDRFFGRGVHNVLHGYGAPNAGLDPMEFPFAYSVRLNTRLITQQLAERNFSRNLESTTQTQHIATFPLTTRTLETLGQGSHIYNAFFAVVPTLSETTLTSTKDFDAVQSVDIWFTYGENDDNLYEFFPLGSGTGFDPAADQYYSTVQSSYGGSTASLIFLTDGNWNVDQLSNYGDATTPRSWYHHLLTKELSVNMSFEATSNISVNEDMLDASLMTQIGRAHV